MNAVIAKHFGTDSEMPDNEQQEETAFLQKPDSKLNAFDTGELLFGGAAEPRIPPQLALHEWQYARLRRNQVFYSRGDPLVVYMNVDCFNVRLSWQFFYDNLIQLLDMYPEIFTVQISLAMILYDELSHKINVFYPSYNTNVINMYGDFMPVHPHTRRQDLARIRHLLQIAEGNEFINDTLYSYAENSRSSLGYPYYVHYTAIRHLRN